MLRVLGVLLIPNAGAALVYVLVGRANTTQHVRVHVRVFRVYHGTYCLIPRVGCCDRFPPRFGLRGVARLSRVTCPVSRARSAQGSRAREAPWLAPLLLICCTYHGKFRFPTFPDSAVV